MFRSDQIPNIQEGLLTIAYLFASIVKAQKYVTYII